MIWIGAHHCVSWFFCIFLHVCIDLVAYTCVYGPVCVCVCYTGVLSLNLHTSPWTWEWPLYLRQSSNTHAHMSTHMDTTAHTPLHYMNQSEVWGGSDTWCSKLTIYVPHDQSKEILLGLRNYFASMYEKEPNHEHSHISTDKMSAWLCTLLKREWQLALQATWLL